MDVLGLTGLGNIRSGNYSLSLHRCALFLIVYNNSAVGLTGYTSLPKTLLNGIFLTSVIASAASGIYLGLIKPHEQEDLRRSKKSKKKK